MFLSPGEKLLKYRKKYGITQEELAGGKVSKTFIGMLEKNQKPLNKKTGKILYNNLISLIKSEKDIITYEVFVKNIDEQIKEYFRNIKEKENEFLKLDQYILEEIVLKLRKTDQNKKIKLIIDIYKKNNRTEDCKIWYTKFFQRINILKGHEDEFLDFLKISIRLQEYKVPFIFLRKYMDEIQCLQTKKQYDEIKYIYLFLLVESKKNNEFFEQLELLKIKDKDVKIKLLKILGKVYIRIGDYNKAIEIYNLFLKKVKNNDEKIEIINNQIDLYIQKKDFIEIKNNYIKLKKIQEKILHKTEENKFNLLYELGRVAEILGRKNESKNYYIEALIIGKGVDVPMEKVMQIILSLFKNFEKNDYYSLLSIEKEYFKILEKHRDYRAALKLIEYYYKNHPKRLDEKFSIINNYLE